MKFRTIVLAIPFFLYVLGALGAQQDIKLNPRLNPFIMSRGSLSESTFISFILKNNSRLEPAYVDRIVKAYFREARAEGVNHDIALSQMLLETGYLNYQGQVSSHQNNFGGIGALDSGEVGASFVSIEEGIRAHVQHLKAYGSTQLLAGELADPRFYLVQRGSARTFQELTGRWATDSIYHKKIAFILDKVLSHETNASLALSH